MSEQLGIKPGEGLVVLGLAPGSPASEAGLTANDLIISVDDAVLRTPADLTKQIRQHAPGDKVRLKLIRKGEPTEIQVTLGTRPAGHARNQEIERVMRKLIDERASTDTQIREAARLAGKAIPNGKDHNTIELPTGASIRVVDENGCVELKTTGERREVVVKDKEDKVVWSGPWNNEEDKKAAPPEVSKRFKDLDIETIFESSRILLTLPGGKVQEK